MDIRLKNKIKSYLNNIWLLEIILVLIILGYIGSDFYQGYKNNRDSEIVSLFKSTYDAKNFYRKEVEGDIIPITNAKYSDYLNGYGLNEDITYNNYNNKDIYDEQKIYYIIENKNTKKVITNDLQLFGAVENSRIDINIEEYINEKLSGNEIIIKYDNENTFSPIVKGVNQSFVEALSDYNEYYYVDVTEYENTKNKTITYLATICCFCFVLFIIKLIVAFIINKGRIKIRGNFIKYFIYIFIYGFKFKGTRKILLISIITMVIFFIIYLYALALGGYEKNILVNFISLYPFKASILMMLLILIGIVFSLKKTIEISLVNEKIKSIDKGEFDYFISKQGSIEIKELIRNIGEIKDDYKKAMDEIVNSEKIKTELITNVSHDLRTPLTSIINYVNILQETGLTDDEIKDYLKILDKKSKKLKVLIDDLFEMSKINSGKMVINKENIDIVSLIYQAIGEYSFLYEDKNVEFNVESEHEEINMSLDGKLISRAIENIVINALKYSLEKTRIYVEIKDKVEYVRLAFKNISNYKMEFDDEDIFEKFVRGDKSRNSNIDGSGLGLAITKSIMELHQGNVEIKREGDMFKIYIYLPKN